MIEYLDKIRKYLPISSDDPENIEYLEYLKSAYEENIDNKKYQFALLAFHMMFMTNIYKQFWCLKEYDFAKVKRFCDRNQQLSEIYSVYDMSILKEKDSIAYTMDSLGFHPNKKSDVQQFVDTRDKCAHASGFIQYNERDVENHFKKVIEYMEQISIKTKPIVQSMFELTLKEFWNSDSFNRLSSAEKAEKIIGQLKLSPADITHILEIDKEQILNDYKSISFLISYVSVMSVLMIRAGTKEGETAIELGNGYLFEELTKHLSKLSSDEFAKIEIELEDEMNALEQANGTISYGEFMSKFASNLAS